jgi:zinc transporter ZupT
MAEENTGKSVSGFSWVTVASALLPVLLLAGILYLLMAQGTGIELVAPAPIENLDFERVILRPGEIEAHVINTGPEELEIVHVQVGWLNRAAWEFEVRPEPKIPRLGRAVLSIPYPWSEGEPYEIAVITAEASVLTHEIDVATETPRTTTPGMMTRFALLGVYVGLIPVFLGIGWLPFLRSLPKNWYYFLLSLTVGLLVFLGVDSLEDALENAERVPEPFQGVAIILIGLSLSLLGLYAISNWMKQRRSQAGSSDAGLVLAYTIAFGIGVHNLGEGLAIGGAYALGEASLGTLLVLGFTLHNLTEGVAIVAPVVRADFRWSHLVWLGALAGGPTIAGTLLGAFAYTPLWAVLFLAIGAGAIIQVVIEITRHQWKQGGAGALVGGLSLAGFALGLAIMYITGLFVTV